MLLSHAKQIFAGHPGQRLLAVDVLRGLTITAMVLVNNPGSWSYVYAPLAHAKWHGYTPTDLIFPFFIFIMGISMAIVAKRHQQLPTRVVLTQGLKRAGKLVLLGLALGLFYYNFRQPDYSWIEQRLMSIRIPGVLQRLGIVFFFTLLIVQFWRRTGQWLWVAILSLGYWAALVWLPYSDDAGNLYQGQLEFGNSLTAWLDNLLLGSSHVYYGNAQPFAFDPEGILSTLPAIAGALIGVACGRLLIDPTMSTASKASKLMMWGLAAIFTAYLWSFILPFNKALWTPSYMLVSSGWAMVLLSLLIWVLDIRGIRLWSAPFIVFGANAIAFFVFSGVVARILNMITVADTSIKNWSYQQFFAPLFGAYNGSLAFALVFCCGCYLVMWQLYRRGIFFKV